MTKPQYGERSEPTPDTTPATPARNTDLAGALGTWFAFLLFMGIAAIPVIWGIRWALGAL